MALLAVSAIGLGSCRLRLAGASGPVSAAVTDQGLELVLTDKKPAAIEVRGLSSEIVAQLATLEARDALWGEILPFHPEGLETADFPPMDGRYSAAAGRIRFEPRHSLAPGINYAARFDQGALPGSKAGEAPPVDLRVSVPDLSSPPPRVETVFPSVAEVPENLLRFYVHFDRPMRRWGYLEHIRLVDETEGRDVEEALHELDEGLWDRSGRRLTLWLEPGRIKRGLRNHIEMGTPIVEGHTYRLEIRSGWPDAAGRKTQETYLHRFAVRAADRRSPDPATWSLTAPPAGGREPLELALHEPLDRELLKRMLEVRHQDRPVAGRWSVSPEADRCHFFPERPWLAGDHELSVDPGLEDLAGNSIRRLFEEDLRSPSRAAPPGRATVAFRVPGTSVTRTQVAQAAGKESS